MGVLRRFRGDFKKRDKRPKVDKKAEKLREKIRQRKQELENIRLQREAKSLKAERKQQQAIDRQERAFQRRLRREKDIARARAVSRGFKERLTKLRRKKSSDIRITESGST